MSCNHAHLRWAFETFMQYGMMHHALVTTNLSPDLPRPLQDHPVGCFYRVLFVMEERSKGSWEALSNITRQARSLLQNVSDSNVQPIEQWMLLDQRPRELRILSTRTQSSSQTMNVNNTSIRNVESTVVATQLRSLETSNFRWPLMPVYSILHWWACTFTVSSFK